MYWSVGDKGKYEMIVDNNEPCLSASFINMLSILLIKTAQCFTLTMPTEKEKKKDFLDYELTVYFCTGTDMGKVYWFRVINIAGERLLDGLLP